MSKISLNANNLSLSMAIFMVVPGHDKCVPRKFVRNLNGRPLFSYALILAKELTNANNIFLFTDDEEVELIAKHMGVRAIMLKTQNLPEQFNDPVIIKALENYEDDLGGCYSICLWLSSSSPLLRKRDILGAMELLLTSGVDSVYSVSEIPRRAWHHANAHQPNFIIERDSDNNVLYTDVPSFYLMNRSRVLKKGYKGKISLAFMLCENHSINIGSIQEFWVAEKLMKRKQILFVVAGSISIGMGHVYRALMLAQDFSEHEVKFLCVEGSDLAEAVISENYYVVNKQAKNNSLLDDVIRLSPDVVVNDILDTSEDYITGLKDRDIKVINLEDQGSGSMHADLVVNALYDKASHSNILVGPKYFDLRDEFIFTSPISLKPEVSCITLTFGGADENNITLQVTKALIQFAVKRDITLQVISGRGYVHAEEFEGYYTSLDRTKQQHIKWIRNGTRKISQYLADSDIAISSAGRTVYELTTLTIPSIVVAANPRETTHFFAQRVGMVYLGLWNKIKDEEYVESVMKLLSLSSRKMIHLKLNKSRDILINGKNNLLKVIRDCILE